MTAMAFGLTIRPSPESGALADMERANARFLDAARAHDLSCWVIDHFQYGNKPIMECLAFLAYHAGQTPGLRWGTLVLGQAYRNPALTAKIGATLQYLTGGRFILGIGGGDAAAEHLAYGYTFPRPANESPNWTRRRRSSSSCGQVGRYRSRGSTTASRTPHAYPRREPPPVLMIGGAGERRTLRVVAEHADWWNADYYSPAEYAHKLAVLGEHCHAIGRDPAAIVPTCYMGLSLSHDPTKLIRRRSMGHRGEVHVISGNPDEVTAQIEDFAVAGVRLMQLNFLDYPRTEGLELFLADVLPRFERPTV